MKYFLVSNLNLENCIVLSRIFQISFPQNKHRKSWEVEGYRLYLNTFKHINY